jgi:hypothetical protein
MKKTILFLLAALCLVQCKRALLAAYGVRNPGFEDRASLNDFLEKHEVRDARLLVFADTAALTRFYRRGLGLPEARFFNASGHFVPYKEEAETCNAGVRDFITDLAGTASTAADPGQTLAQELDRVYSLSDGKPFEIAALPPADYYVVAYWARYIGKINKKVWDWQTEIEKARAKGVRIELLLVNADFQKLWGLGDDQLPKIKNSAIETR